MQLHRIDRLEHELLRKWAAARIWSAHQVPYMATALLALDAVVVDQSDEPEGARFDLSALPVDTAWHIYVDPEVLSRTDVPMLGFWMVHQVAHLLRHHADRSPVRELRNGVPLGRRTRDQRTWNMATDAEIDDDLVAGDAIVPEAAVTPMRLGLPESLTAEQYYEALQVDGALHLVTESTMTDCGSGCDALPRPWECNWPGLSPTAGRLCEHDVARRIREHSRKRGTVPAGWQRWADELLEPTVSWQRVLASAVRRGAGSVAGRVDFTYRKPSRRSAVLGDVVLPSLYQPLPKVAMVLDTSGSMSDSMLSQSLAEVGGVLRSLGVGRRNLQIICCDARSFDAQKVMKAGDVQLLGGGGTNMGAGLAAAGELRPRPDLVVVLTDGFTPWPDAPPPNTRVIVGLMHSGGSVPDWAETVLIEADAGAQR